MKRKDGKKSLISVEMPVRLREMIGYLKTKGYGESDSEVVRNVVHDYLGVFRYDEKDEYRMEKTE